MAFGSEIRFKIGGDTSALSRSFVAAQSIAATAGKQLERKLGLKDAFKGLMQGIGIGSVDAIAQAVIRPFEHAADKSRTLAAMTNQLREITTEEIGQTGGHEAHIREMAREANDLNVDIEQTQKLVDELNASPLILFNTESYALMKEAEQELANMKVRQAKLQSTITIDQKNSSRAVQEWNKEQATLNKLQQADLKDSGDKAKLQIRLNALRTQGVEIGKREGRDSAQYMANQAAQLANIREQQLLSKKAAEDRRAERVALGVRAAERPANRGRSETERIAARGAGFAAQAEQEILKGGNPAFIGRLTRQANRDLGTAGQRIAAAASGVDKDPSLQGIKSELITANTTLSNINKNLAPVTVESTPRRTSK